MLFEFFTHADENPHGWGYAEFSKPEPFVQRSPERANTGNQAAKFFTHPHIARTALAHIRYATVGQVEQANCHPFTPVDVSGRHWTLIHKGTVFDYSPLNPYFQCQAGSTDSERILLYLVDWINAATQCKELTPESCSALTADKRFAVFTSLVEVLSPGNCISLAVYDSEQLFIYSNYQGGLNIVNLQDSVVCCTSELTVLSSALSAPPNTQWQPLPLCTPLSYMRGELVFSAASVGKQYFDNDEDTRYLYQDFAAL